MSEDISRETAYARRGYKVDPTDAAEPAGFAKVSPTGVQIVELDAGDATIGTVDQGASGNDPWAMKDRLIGFEALEDQSGAGAVLTFTFSAAVDLVWVRSVGAISRADPNGGTPTATKGVYLADDEPTPITFSTSEVKVFAPAGATVSVWGFRYGVDPP